MLLRIKMKEKEFSDQKMNFDRVKDDKRRLQIELEEKNTDLQMTVNSLTNENKLLRT